MPYIPGPNNALIYVPQIPGPDNELINPTPPDTSSRFPIIADSASYAATASFFVGYIESSSYSKFAETASFLYGVIESASFARTAATASTSITSSFSRFAATASYLLGSVSYAISCSWAALAGHALTADTASYAILAATASCAQTSSLAKTASYVLLSVSSSYSSTSSQASYSVSASYSSVALVAQTAVTASYSVQSSTASYLNSTASYASTASFVDLTGIQIKTPSGSLAYINAFEVSEVSSPTMIDTFSTGIGHSCKWLLSISDGVNFKSSEILSIWDPATNTTNFAEVTTNSLGTIPVAMSVSLSAGQVRLIANPSSGTWTMKFIRFLL